MSQKIHSQARTTVKIRAEIQASTGSERQLARKYNVSRQTIRKWRKRTQVSDLSHCPHKLSTNLTPLEEEIVIEIRRLLLLPLDDLLVITRKFINPTVSRAGLHRCLKRHGVSNLKVMQAERLKAETGDEGTPQKKTFKDYEPGYLHIDIKYLPKMPDEESRRYLYVGIDRATRWVHVHIYANQSQESSEDFLERVVTNCPVKIRKILTDNGTQFTDRFTSKEKQPLGEHVFDKACKKHDIEHRLIPPRHPQTNGMVERFNGRISEVLKQTRFTCAAELESTLLAYVVIYNNHIPQKALKHLSPIQVMQNWQQNKPEIFTSLVHNHTIPDT
jgi:transposase-like protein